MEQNYYLLTFESTHDAIASEKALGPRFPVAIMPTLRQITAACGISLRVETPFYAALQNALEERAIPSGSYRLYAVQGAEIAEVT